MKLFNLLIHCVGLVFGKYFYMGEAMKKKRFVSRWFCVVEIEHDEKTMRSGADSPMRRAVEEAVKSVAGNVKISYMSSCWGLNEVGVNCVNNVTCERKFLLTIDECESRDKPRKKGLGIDF